MKVAVYLAMLLLSGPLLRVAGAALSAVFLAVMFGIGVYLIFHRKDRPGGAPHDAPPQVVVVVPAEHWQWPQPPAAPTPPPAAVEAADVRATHPARRPRHDIPPLWVRPGQ